MGDGQQTPDYGWWSVAAYDGGRGQPVEARRRKIPRARYKVTNWPEYDKALQQRGSLTVWVTPETLDGYGLHLAVAPAPYADT